MTVSLMPHQLKAINELDNGKVLWGGVGTGKTLTALGYYFHRELMGDIYVITTARLRDSLEWESKAAKFGISTDRDSSLGGALIVDSWNNIGKYVDVKGAFFIFDEQRVVGSGAWVKSFYTISRANGWILLSATPGDTWVDYIPLFVANGYYKNKTEFIRRHVVYSPYSKFPRIVRYLDEERLERLKRMLLVEMPYARHTTRVMKHEIVDYDPTVFNDLRKRRWNPYEDRPCRNVGELFRVLRRVTTEHPSRMTRVHELLDEHPKSIIFYTYDYELDILRTLSSRTTVAEWNGHRKQPIPDTDDWVYLVQYSSGGEGWNCTETDTVIFFSLTYSYKLFEQAQGRIDRLNTPFVLLFYYVLSAKSVTDIVVQRAIEAKKNFNLNDADFGPEWGEL